MSETTLSISDSPLARAVAVVKRLPSALRPRAITTLFRSQVPFVGTAGVRFEKLTKSEAIVVVKNRRSVQNHIHGVHAAAMALLAETATGAMVGMNLPDASMPLLKSMHVDYVKRATGSLRAVATLTAEQRKLLTTTPKGDTVVPVTVTDEAGVNPIVVTMTWAWIPKKKR